jgi:hypothetical protein
MSLSPAPINQQIVDESGLPTLPWTLFFNETFNGDAGNAFAPNFVGLSSSGTPTITGRFYRLSQYLVYFRIDVVPSTNTSATAGTTYVDNFPLNVTGNGFCTVVAGNSGGSIGMVRASDKRIYVPAWTNVTDTVSVLGICEAR